MLVIIILIESNNSIRYLLNYVKPPPPRKILSKPKRQEVAGVRNYLGKYSANLISYAILYSILTISPCPSPGLIIWKV